MANMFPRRLPQYAQSDPGRAAERKFYEALAEGLDEGYRVFYSVAWLSKPQRGGARDGEVDFVIAHAENGLLLLEVKGGRIARDGSNGKWASMDRNGKVHEIKDPIEQVRRSKYALLDKMKEHPRIAGQYIQIGHAVVLPDCETPRSPLSTDAPHDIVVFAADLSNIGTKIESIFKYWRSKHGDGQLGASGVKAVTQLLAPSFDLRMPLGVALGEDDRKILELTEQQFRVLDLLSRQRRVSVTGGAGTGKTVLALEKAKRLAAEGLSVLLTCYNRPLSEYLAASAGGVENLEICNFHQLCYRWAKDAGSPLPHSGGDRKYFDETMPEALMSAVDRLEKRYDAIVVDEGQDFHETWWTPLQLCLSDPDTGILYVFRDDNQRIYQRVSTYPGNLIEIPLTDNLRNTKTIHALASRFYHGGDLRPLGPDGREIELVVAKEPGAIAKETGRALHRLIREQEIRAGDIAILCGKSIERGSFGGTYKLGAFEITQDQDVEPNKVLLKTIHSFKGLERPVVVLADIDGLPHDKQDELLYVGVTRARTHLAVVVQQETADMLGLVAS